MIIVAVTNIPIIVLYGSGGVVSIPLTTVIYIFDGFIVIHVFMTITGSATPRSTIIFQGATGVGNASYSHAYKSNTNQDIVHRSLSDSNSSTVLEQLNSDGMKIDDRHT